MSVYIFPKKGDFKYFEYNKFKLHMFLHFSISPFPSTKLYPFWWLVFAKKKEKKR